MATNGFVGYASNSLSNGDAGPNSIFLTPLIAQQNGTAVAVLLDCFSATPSTTFKALIYDAAHSVLLASSAQFTATVSGYNRFQLTAPLSLVAGTTYYVGYVCSTGLPVSIQGSGGPPSWYVNGGQSVAAPANPLAAGAINAVSLSLALELDGAGSTGLGFSPDQAAGITLSASNTLATFSSAATKGARSVVTQLAGTGKWYAEFAVGGTLANNVGVGIATANWGTTEGTAAVAYGYFLLPTGALQASSGTTALGLTYVSGDVIGIAFDAAANLLWFSKNGGSFFGASSTAGNPAAGTGGAAVLSRQWPLTLIGSTGSTATAPTLTLRDTAGAMQYTPPAGFSAWSTGIRPAPTILGGQTVVTINTG